MNDADEDFVELLTQVATRSMAKRKRELEEKKKEEHKLEVLPNEEKSPKTDKDTSPKKDADAVENKSDIKSEAVEPTPEELREQCEKWGLGRGVDITKQTPWMEKTSFQVRAVRTEDLMETDEGGLLKGYSDLVDSSTSIHSQVRAGVKTPNVPLAIGVDSEYSRTDCSSKHVVGLKVKNRTISFRVDFEDVPKLIANENEAKKMIKGMNKAKMKEMPSTTRKQARMIRNEEAKSEATPRQIDVFETRLCTWLNDCLRHRGVPGANADNLYELLDTTIKKKDGPVKKLIDDGEQTRRLEEDISRFVAHIGVTHYISAIELGGLRFSILSEQEYEKKVAASGSASLNSLLYGGVEAQIKNSFTRRSKSRRTERKQIGKITSIGEGEDARETVERKDEAVIGCQIRPISGLVRNPYIRLAVEKGVKEYTEKKISFGGPYLVSCGDDQPMYLTADHKTRKITITFNKKKADAFTVKMVNETRHHHELEFSLTSSLSQPKKTDEVTDLFQSDVIVPLEYTMEIDRNAITGHGSKAPRMRLSTNHRQTRLLLKKRSDRRISCDTKDWIKGTEAYYIQCIHPLAKAFLCVKEKNSFRKHHGKGNELDPENDEKRKDERFKVCVTGCGSAQRDETHYYMLFRLHPQEVDPKTEQPKDRQNAFEESAKKVLPTTSGKHQAAKETAI